MLSLREDEGRVTCKQSNSLEVEGREQGGQGAGRAGTQDPQETARKHCPACICNFFCMLNEMSPFVSFLVGYVENYFQKFVLNHKKGNHV